jgi:transposase InsO family protein
LSTKVHQLVDGHGYPLVVLVGPGQAGDAPMFEHLMAHLRIDRPGPGRARTRPDRLRADKAYSSRAIRGHLRRRRVVAVIPEPADQQGHRTRRGSRGGRPPAFDRLDYRNRNVVERGFCTVKHWRGLATRYDQLAITFRGGAVLKAIVTWLRALGDTSYVRTYESFTYVAFIVDCFSQKIVGWHAALNRDVELVDAPLRMALWRRAHEGNTVERDRLVCHSDAGSQYTSVRFTEHLHIEGIRPSIGSVGDAYDNALMETINGLYKAECIRTPVFHDGPWRTIADVEYATAIWVEWYNNRRLHSSLGMISPTEFEAAHYADPEPSTT